MSKKVNGHSVLTYQEWLECPGVKDLLASTYDDCPVCDGEGEHVCECGDSHGCSTCGGEGQENNLRELYEATLLDQLQKIKLWMEGKKIEHPRFFLSNDNDHSPSETRAIVQIFIKDITQ